MTLTQLHYVITIAETKSFNKAAEKLYVSQPSLTSAIKELEKELGISIFYRNGRGAVLTNDGTEFLLYAKQIYGQYENVLEKYGKRPLAYMEDMNWVGNDVWYAHGIHFNDEELNLLAQTGTGVAHCPISNMKLSSGICRIPDMLKLGVPVGLAVDGSASNDGSNLLEELRVAFLLHRLNSSKLAPSGYDLLKIATNGSAKILGRNDIGSLSIGKAGDLFMIRRNRLELVGADLDVKSMLGTVGFKGTVDYTIVNGKIVVKEGQLTGIDEEKAIYNCRQEVNKYLNH